MALADHSLLKLPNMGSIKKRILTSQSQTELGLQKIKKNTMARNTNDLMLNNNRQIGLNPSRKIEKCTQSQYHDIAFQTDGMTEKRSHLLNSQKTQCQTKSTSQSHRQLKTH
jgi:hypothetical protein